VSLFEAHLARDEGMARALAHAERTQPDWGELAYQFLRRFAEATPIFISEDVSDHSRGDHAFPQPPTDRAWGPVYRRALRDGVIEQSGIGRSRRRHASICPQWKSLVLS
jgi:hypothetical protein